MWYCYRYQQNTLIFRRACQMTVTSVVRDLFPVPRNITKGCSSNSRCQPSSCILSVLARFSGTSSAISSLRNVSWLWRSATEKTNSFHAFFKKYMYISTRYRNVPNNFSNNLILANKERALAVRSNVFDHLTSKVYDAKQIVHRLQETLEWNQASLEQPNHEAKKWIRSLTREARRSERLDVVEHLREITPAGTTGECLFCSSVFFYYFYFYFFLSLFFYRE